jgi:hypothetical protein
LFAYFVVVLVNWMSFASGIRDLRGDALSMLETHIVMSSLIFRLILTLVLHLALLHAFFLSPLMDLTIAHMVFGSRENWFEPRRFGYGPHHHYSDRFLRRPGFSVLGFHTHFESRHLNGPHFSHRGSRPTHSNGDVQKIVKTSFGRMVKCWIPKIYLTNPSTESSTFSHPM